MTDKGQPRIHVDADADADAGDIRGKLKEGGMGYGADM